MAKRVNIASMSDAVLQMFSDYNKADFRLEQLAETFKAEKSELEAARDEAADGGDDKAVAEYVRQINELTAKYAEDKKPLTVAKQAAMKLFPSVMHSAYVVAMKKGDYSATGSVSVTTKKNGKEVTTVYTVGKEQSFRSCMRRFMESCGMYSPSDHATDKHVQAMLLACGGLSKTSKARTGARASVRGERQFSELVVRVYLDEFMEGNNAFSFMDDGEIIRNNFCAETLPDAE